MKKIYFIFLCIVISITGCSHSDTYTSTYGQIKVIDKDSSQDNKEFWITAFDPNNETKEHSKIITVKEHMVWNLIEVDTDYMAGYDKTGNQPWMLKQIKKIDNEKKYNFTYLEDLPEDKLLKYDLFLNDGNINHLTDFTPDQIVLIYMNLVMSDNIDRIYALTNDEGQLPSLDVFKDKYTMFLSQRLKDNYL